MKKFDNSALTGIARWLPTSAKALLVLLMVLGLDSKVYAELTRLEVIQKELESKYPAVNHISDQEVEKMRKESEEIVIFDVRESAEFEVSHLAGAIQVDPDISSATFNQMYGESVSGKTVVFYCSVGRRSSLLADKVSDQLSAQGADEIYNLQHGIFGWHNEQRALIADTEKTDYVHPFNWFWGRLLDRRDMIRYSAE